jgi:GDP-mannose 6-dehydrogenase
MLREIYGHLPAEFCVTSIRVAELLKYCCNTFHALKIAFVNEIGGLARSLEIDPNEVADLLCRDRQLNISAAYMRPGFAFGGPCLPKDVEALVHLAKDRDVEAPLLSSILPSNRARLESTVRSIVSCTPKSVGLLGLSFKAGTDDLRARSWPWRSACWSTGWMYESSTRKWCRRICSAPSGSPRSTRCRSSRG